MTSRREHRTDTSDVREGTGHVPQQRGTGALPPKPGHAPEGGRPPLADWLRRSRPEAAPGIFRCGHHPPPPEDADRIPTRQLVWGALVSFLAAWLVCSLLWNGYLGGFWLWPMDALRPEAWDRGYGALVTSYLYYVLVFGGIAVVFGRMGRWNELARRALSSSRPRRRPQGPPPPPPPAADPARWPQLRAAGAEAAADRLTAETDGGRMTDVDHARIVRAWQAVRSQPARLSAFTDDVLHRGAAACPHPSGDRDLPARAARHDLSLRQVRIGAALPSARNPHDYRGAALALDPTLLGTSALVVGPPGSGKTSRLVRPVTESLCLQALAGQAAVVAVTSAGARLAPDEVFDVVVRPGDPSSAHDLDLYGGSDDPDEAAGMLAEALVGDLAGRLPGGDGRPAATALAQLLAPFQAAHGRFPDVPELRALLDGGDGDGADGHALTALREALTADDHASHLRDLDAYARRAARPGDIAQHLADRLATLDRPAFAGFFRRGGTRRAFSLRDVEHPLRVRVDLPEGPHAEASRVLVRLVLAQFGQWTPVRADQSLFSCLLLDDAASAVTPSALRTLQRVRSANAGVLLTLRALDEVPEPLRAPLLGAVGCRVVCSGVTPWDAERFAEAWGTEWVQTKDVTNRQLVSDEPLTKVVHAMRRLATGRHVTAESVTVRTVERRRWSASDLANELPPGHAVLSFTTVRGERTPPLLARLGE